MKRLVVVFLLLLILPICFGKDVLIEGVSGVESDGGVRTSEGATYYAVLSNNVVASKSGVDVIYYHRDRVGSNIRVTGGEVSKSKTLPFGKELESPHFRNTFTGKELDGSGLYYYGARYYDFDLGRFVSTDPVFDEKTYVYVENNPLRFVDPTGSWLKKPNSMGDISFTGNGFYSSETQRGEVGVSIPFKFSEGGKSEEGIDFLLYGGGWREQRSVLPAENIYVGAGLDFSKNSPGENPNWLFNVKGGWEGGVANVDSPGGEDEYSITGVKLGAEGEHLPSGLGAFFRLRSAASSIASPGAVADDSEEAIESTYERGNRAIGLFWRSGRFKFTLGSGLHYADRTDPNGPDVGYVESYAEGGVRVDLGKGVEASATLRDNEEIGIGLEFEL